MSSKQPIKKTTQISVPEEPKEEEQAVHVENEGFGRFEYMNGAIYEGEWKIFEGEKMKHGQGLLIQQSQNRESGVEEYKGSWNKDKMDGYGVYKYTSGAIYYGEWKDNLQNGKGIYEFPDGCVYDGEWKDHKMNGTGYFLDRNGIKWEGEFVDGIYQSKVQKELKQEKILKVKEQEIRKNFEKCLEKFKTSLQQSEKKNLKQTIQSFFCSIEECQTFINPPITKFEERKPEIWKGLLETLFENFELKILRTTGDSTVISKEEILTQQLNGIGQIVEIRAENLNAAFCNIQDDHYALVMFHES